MKNKVVFIGGLVVAFSMFIGSSASAACTAPRMEVTVIDSAGKSVVVCIAEQAIPHIGGDGAVVVPAVCPCFRQRDLETAASQFTPSCGAVTSIKGADNVTEEQVNAEVGFNDDSEIFLARWKNGTAEGGVERFALDLEQPRCKGIRVSDDNICKHGKQKDVIAISLEQAQACVEVLWATFKWVSEDP